MIVLPTPFSQMTYCTGQRCREGKTYVDFIILVFADGVGQGEAGAEEEVDGAAEETFGERREVLVLAAVPVVPASMRLGERVAERVGRGGGGGGMADGRPECARARVQPRFVAVVRVRVFKRKVVRVRGGRGGDWRRPLPVPQILCCKALCVAVAHLALCLVHDTQHPAEHPEAVERFLREVLGGSSRRVREEGGGDEREEVVCEVVHERGDVGGVRVKCVADVVCAEEGVDVLRRGEQRVPLRPVRDVRPGDHLRPGETLHPVRRRLELELGILRRGQERQPDRLRQ